MESYKITREKFMEKEQTDMLMKTCQEQSDLDLMKGRRTWIDRYMLVHLALYSGLRVSEIAGLKLKDLHLCNVKDPYLTTIGKGKRKRDVYLDSQLTKHLKFYQDYKKKTVKESVDPDSPLFSGRNGNHITTTALEISYKKATMKAGLPKHYAIHSARHTYATLLLHSTKNLRYVQKQLGHASIAMTSLYADILPSENGNLANMILED